ncbi:hypothetical protein ACFPYJ_13915 [Paenibacillus solisilvae]|uniref:LuxR family transcriptional regulator n=1 Tax=Paenibacillus solisilvae TaxID=2486751 RepID=A0ABW0VWF2_9BACL
MYEKATRGAPELADYTHPVLSTKLYIPQHPVKLVSRDRLDTAMYRILQCRLTSVIAPAGFGKTTLVSDWIMSRQVRSGWVSLDPGENDLHRFWSYIVTAFDRLQQGIGKKAQSLLQSPISFSIDKMVSWLLNDLDDASEDLVLVLDDYHCIDSMDVHASLAYFLDHLPKHIHLCILSRRELPFPVATLRGKRELNPIGMDELKFTEDEIASFWQRQTGELPDPFTLQLLADRTEGWAAGIQLAALSGCGIQGARLQQFTGNHRYVADYLMEEVFQALDETIRHFLMQTSILNQMN